MKVTRLGFVVLLPVKSALFRNLEGEISKYAKPESRFKPPMRSGDLVFPTQIVHGCLMPTTAASLSVARNWRHVFLKNRWFIFEDRSVFRRPLFNAKVTVASSTRSILCRSSRTRFEKFARERKRAAVKSAPLLSSLRSMAGESVDPVALEEELTMSDEVREPVFKKQNVEVVVASKGITKCNGGDEKLSCFRVKRLAPEAILPSRGSAFSAGYDLSSAYLTIVPARGKALVKTELAIAIPEGTYARIAPRSGLDWNHSIDVGAGVIDFDYRGPVGVILFNHSDTDFFINAGDRIGQLILEKIVTPEVVEVDDLGLTARGEGGFGSTGVRVSAIAEVTVGDAVDDA